MRAIAFALLGKIWAMPRYLRPASIVKMSLVRIQEDSTPTTLLVHMPSVPDSISLNRCKTCYEVPRLSRYRMVSRTPRVEKPCGNAITLELRNKVIALPHGFTNSARRETRH